MANLTFEISVLGQLLQGGRSYTIQAEPGHTFVFGVALSNHEASPVDLAYIAGSPKPSNNPTDSFRMAFREPLQPNQAILFPAQYAMPIHGNLDIEFEADGFSYAGCLPGEPCNATGVYYSTIKVKLIPTAMTIPPGGGTPSPVISDAKFPWPVAVAGLLVVPIILYRNKNGK